MKDGSLEIVADESSVEKQPEPEVELVELDDE